MAQYGDEVFSGYGNPHEVQRTGVTGKTVSEERRDTPVLREVDVAVVGGGPGGVAAAISAARAGLSRWFKKKMRPVNKILSNLVLKLSKTYKTVKIY